MLTKLAITAILVATTTQAAETDFRSLSPAERASLAQEIRGALLADPALVLPAFPANPPVAVGYQDEIDADRSLLAELADTIFSNLLAGTTTAPRLALVTASNCPQCTTMQDTLTQWAKQGRLRLYTLPLDSVVAQRLGLDTAPSYIFDGMIVRGDVPPIVLEKYLRKQGG